MSLLGSSPSAPNPNPYAHPPPNLSAVAPSAIFGHPAANLNDWYIIRAFERSSGIPDGIANPAMGVPFQAPPGSLPYNSRGPSLIGTSAMVIFLTLMITSTRLALRYFKRDLRVGYDDYAIIPASLGVCVWFSLVIAMVVKGGAGKHLYNVTYMEIYWFAYLADLATIIFYITVGLISISITLFNRRLTGLTSTRWMIAHNTFLSLLTIYIILAVSITSTACSPQVGLSLIKVGKLPHPQKCKSSNTIGIAFSSLHIAFDFALLTVPLIVLYNMHMSTTKKLRLAFLFSIGSVSCIGAVMRQVIQKQGALDLTWAFQTDYAWTAVDMVFAITAASLPVLNAAVPKGWRGQNDVKKLGNLNLLEQGSEKSGGVEHGSGTMGEVDKDSFHKKTESRWEDAFVNGLGEPRGGRVGRVLCSEDTSTKQASSEERSREGTLFTTSSKDGEVERIGDGKEDSVV